jgi:hypothetical protein
MDIVPLFAHVRSEDIPGFRRLLALDGIEAIRSKDRLKYTFSTTLILGAAERELQTPAKSA